MLTLLNQKFRVVLIAVLVIVGISFVFFGPEAGSGRPGAGAQARIQGKIIPHADFAQMFRAVQVLYTLQTGQMPDRSSQMEEILVAQSWHRLVVLADARQAGLSIPPSAVVGFIQAHPFFTDPETGRYNPRAFEQFNLLVLQPQGVSIERFQEIIRDQMLFELMLETVADTVVILPSEVEQVWRSLYGKAKMTYVRIPLSAVLGDIDTSEAALRVFYESNKSAYLSPEKRRARVVIFPAKLDDEQAMREAAEKAFAFSDPFYRAYEEGGDMPDFATQAADAGVSVTETGWINIGSPLIKDDEQGVLGRALFRLTDSRSVSDSIRFSGGFAVIEVLEVEQPRTREFEEVAAQVATDYRQSEEQRLLRQRINLVHEELVQSLSEGNDWSTAVAATGVQSAELPAFSPAADNFEHPLADEARFWAQQLSPGALGQPVIEDDFAVIFYLASREDPQLEEAELLQERVVQQLERQRRYQAQEAWLRSRYELPGTVLPSFDRFMR